MTAGFGPEALLAVLRSPGLAGVFPSPHAPDFRSRRVWIAYSGGGDSTALLAAAAALGERLPGTLGALYIDHGQHPDSSAWGDHCRTLCARLSVPFRSRRVAVRPGPGDSLEAVARDVRYEASAALLNPGDLLLTAHQREDQAETLLLALLRGSGVQGLAAMPLAAPLGFGWLVRPLLGFGRGDLERYARARGLTWLEDPSNQDPAMDRNYLRHQVLPLLRARWPAVSATLARSAAHCAEAAALVDQAAGAALPALAGGRPGTLAIPRLLALEPAQCRAVLRCWLGRLGLGVPSSAQLGRILTEVLPARPDADPLVAWPGAQIRRYRGDLYGLVPLPARLAGLDLPWTDPVLRLPGGLGTLERDPDAALPPGGLRVRLGVGELRCRPPGATHRRTLKNLFQEAGIPPWLRPLVPRVFAGDTLIALAGLCPCAPVGGLAIRWTGHPWEAFAFLGPQPGTRPAPDGHERDG